VGPVVSSYGTPKDAKNSTRGGALYVNGHASKGSKSSPQLGGGAPTFERSPRSRQTTGSSSVFEGEEEEDGDEEEDEEEVAMNLLDLRMIKKLGKRVNVLPVSLFEARVQRATSEFSCGIRSLRGRTS
jgi:hypothetical protein